MGELTLGRQARIEAGRDRLAGLFPGLISASAQGPEVSEKSVSAPKPAAVTLADDAPAPAPREMPRPKAPPSPQVATARVELEFGDTLLNLADDFAADPFSRQPEAQTILQEMQLDFDSIFGIESVPEPVPARGPPEAVPGYDTDMPRPGF